MSVKGVQSDIVYLDRAVCEIGHCSKPRKEHLLKGLNQVCTDSMALLPLDLESCLVQTSDQSVFVGSHTIMSSR
jgi:hypothetical protein